MHWVCHAIFCPGLNFVLGLNMAGILLSDFVPLLKEDVN